MKMILLILGLCTLYMPTQSQNIKSSNITWNSSQCFHISSGVLTPEANRLVSKATNQIVWEKSDGTTETFNASEVLGQWPDVAQPGEIVYEVRNEESTGTITFIRTTNDIRIRLLLITDEPGPKGYELIVNDYNIQ